jgi:hypothetical protein
MEEVEVAFDVPEEIAGVRSWFVRTLQPLAGVRRSEKMGSELVLEEPRVGRLTGPDADGTGFEIVIAARRIETIPVPSSWCPVHLVEGFDTQELNLSAVMAFRLFPLHGETYVLASCVERPAALWKVFEDFLRQVEARYPALGPFWQATAAQQRERMKADLRRKFGGAQTLPAQDAPGERQGPRVLGGDAGTTAGGANAARTQGDLQSQTARYDFSFVLDDNDRLMLELYFNEGLTAPVIVQRADVLRFSTAGPWRNWLTAMRKQYPGRIPDRKPPRSQKR